MHTLLLAGLLTPLVCGPQRTHTHTHTHADLEDHLQSTPVVQEGRLFLFCEVYFHTCERAHLRERGLGIHAVRARDKPRSHIILPPPPPLPPYGEYSKKMEEGLHGELVHKVEEDLLARPQRRSIWYVYIHIYVCVCIHIHMCVYAELLTKVEEAEEEEDLVARPQRRSSWYVYIHITHTHTHTHTHTQTGTWQ